MNFKEFKDKYREFALGLDLKNELPIVYNIYKQKDSLVEGTDDIDDLYEIIDFCKKAKRDMMHKINLHIEHNYNKTRYIGFIAPVFFHLRCYLDYDVLLNKTTQKISNHENDSNYKESLSCDKEIEKRFDNNIFTNSTGFEIFKNFSESRLENPYKDFSFIFYSLFGDGFIRQITHKNYFEWLFENNYIDDNLRTVFYEKGNLCKKSDTKARRLLYETIKKNTSE